MKYFNLVIVLVTLVSGAAFADAPATHGMLFFGTSKTYISHLPMFHRPHDYQWVAEVELPQAVKESYLASGVGLHTLVPQPFVLPDVAQRKQPFFATLFEGHFEKGGTPITRLFQVKIVHNLVFKKFDPHASAHVGYEGYAIGNKLEKFIIHSIVKAPDYDQVIQVDPLNLKFVKEGSVFPISASVSGPLTSNSTVLINPNTRTAEEIQLLNEIYLEKEELGG